MPEASLGIGGPAATVTADEPAAFVDVLAKEIDGTGARSVLLVPPGLTRLHSRGGEIVARFFTMPAGEIERVDVIPALGTDRSGLRNAASCSAMRSIRRVLSGLFAGEGGPRAAGGDAVRGAVAQSARVNIGNEAIDTPNAGLGPWRT